MSRLSPHKTTSTFFLWEESLGAGLAGGFYAGQVVRPGY